MAIATTRWDGMRWTLVQARVDEAPIAYGEVVWSWRRDAGAKPVEQIPQVTVTTSPLTGESTK